MTLNQLAEHLNTIITENTARGWSDRNDLPVVVEVSPLPRAPRQHHKPSQMFALEYASSSMTTFNKADGTPMAASILATSESKRLR